MIFTIRMAGITQNRNYLKLNINPSFSWKSNEPSKIKLVNSLGLSIGRRFGNKISIETGVGLNKVAYKLIRVAEVIGVVDGFSTYLLEGEIPVKQKFTDRFIEIPLQVNYEFYQKDNINIFFYSRLSSNFIYESFHENWYHYKTEEEFTTKNTYVNSQGKETFALSYQLGAIYRMNIHRMINLGMGINYKNLFHKHKFPSRPEDRVFHNIGIEANILYWFGKEHKN